MKRAGVVVCMELCRLPWSIFMGDYVIDIRVIIKKMNEILLLTY